MSNKDPIHLRIQRGDPVKLLFRQEQCPGDILTLTASIRDLKKAYPNLLICVKTSANPIWENNPYVTDFPEK